MIDTIKIYKGLRASLEGKFPNDTVQIKDIKNITRPSYYLRFVSENRTKTAPKIEQITNVFEIIYFAEENKLLELLQAKNGLNELSDKKISVTDGQKTKFALISDVESSLNEEEYYLQTTITIEFAQIIPDDDSDFVKMQKLKMDNEITE